MAIDGIEAELLAIGIPSLRKTIHNVEVTIAELDPIKNQKKAKPNFLSFTRFFLYNNLFQF